VTVLLRTMLADITSHIDSSRHSGLRYWARVFGKLLFTPAVQVVVVYRISALLYRNPLTRPLAFILRSFTIVWGGTEIHPAAVIGPGLCLVHSQKVLIGEGVRIGRDVRISHGVSIGGDPGRGGPSTHAGWPTIGDGVTIALDSIILGPLTVGDGAFISAQSFVVKDVPPYGVVAGSPARLVRRLDPPLTAADSPRADEE
jgi:serine O-acetyltransferase